MATHEDLRAWQAADAVAFGVYRWADSNWSPQLASLIDQLRRASLSVALNIAEGYACGPGARCRSHLRIAYGSAVETTAILDFLARLGHDVGELPDLSRSTKALTYRLWAKSRPR